MYASTVLASHFHPWSPPRFLLSVNILLILKMDSILIFVETFPNCLDSLLISFLDCTVSIYYSVSCSLVPSRQVQWLKYYAMIHGGAEEILHKLKGVQLDPCPSNNLESC